MSSITVVKGNDRLFIKVGSNSNLDHEGIKEAQWFHKLFGQATTITINGQAYAVNTNSLKKFLVRISPTNNKQLAHLAAKGATATDQSKKIREAAFNAFKDAATQANLSFDQFLEKQIAFIQRENLTNRHSTPTVQLTILDAEQEGKWSALFQKTVQMIEGEKPRSSSITGSLGMVIVSTSIQLANSQEQQERERLIKEFKAAVEVFYGYFTHQLAFSISTIEENVSQLSIQELRSNTAIAKRLAALIQAEKKVKELTAHQQDLEATRREIDTAFQRIDQEITQLTSVLPIAELVSKKIKEQKALSDDEIGAFAQLPQHSLLLKYNQLLVEGHILETTIQSQQLELEDATRYLTGLTECSTQLAPHVKSIDELYRQVQEKQIELSALNLTTIKDEATDKVAQEIETIKHHLSILEQLLLSIPSSSKFSGAFTRFKQIQAHTTSVTKEAVDAKIAELQSYIDQQKQTLSAPEAHKHQMAQSLIKKYEQTIKYYELFGKKDDLIFEIELLKGKLKKLEIQAQQSEKTRKASIQSQAGTLKSEISTLEQQIQEQVAAFSRIVDGEKKPKESTKASPILAKVKSALKIQKDGDKKELKQAVHETDRLFKELQTEIEAKKATEAQLQASIQIAKDKQVALQPTLSACVQELTSSLDLASKISSFQQASKTQGQAYQKLEDDLFAVKEQIVLAQRAEVDAHLENLPDGHLIANLTQEAAIINTYYLLSTFIDENFRQEVEGKLQQLRHTSHTIDFSHYENPLIFNGAKKWLQEASAR